MITKNILCYGDSNTFGRIPGKIGPGRYERSERWPGLLQDFLGEEYHVVEEGLGGRTTVINDAVEGRMSGLDYLKPCLLSHSPLDLVVFQLGTNDLKDRYAMTPIDIALGMERLVDVVNATACGRNGETPRVLIITPPPIIDVGHVKFKMMFSQGFSKSLELGGCFKHIAERYGNVDVMDISGQVRPSEKDGIHFEAGEHRAIAMILAGRIKGLIG
jgi:lysophospholipase L1-like esterase